jgi:lipopolysaccharide assembly protein B
MSPTTLFALFCVLAILVILYYVVSRSKPQTDHDHLIDGLEAMLESDWKKAAHHLRLAVELDSDNIRAYEQLGCVYRELGEYKRAFRIHRDLTVRSGLPANRKARIFMELARSLRQLGKIEEALEASEKAASADRKNIEAQVVRLELLECKSDWDGALAQLKRIETSSQRDQNHRRSLILVEQAKELITAGNGRQGRIQIKEALKKNSACAPAYLLMGDSYLKEDRNEEAIKYWEQLPFEAPGHGYLVFERLEKLYFECNCFSEMEKFYRRVIDQGLNTPEAYLALAGFYERKGELDRAMSLIEQGMEKTNNDLNLARFKVKLLARTGDHGKLSAFAQELANSTIEKSSGFTCTHCGTEYSEYEFRCKKCCNWESLERTCLC